MEQRESTSTVHPLLPKQEIPDVSDLPDTVEPSQMEADDFLCVQKCVFCQLIMTLKDNSKLLECLHPACDSCLKSSTGSGDVDGGEQPQTKLCPVCNVPSHPDKMIENKFLVEICALSNDGDSRCLNHPDTIASDWCVDCSNYMCQNCVTCHKTLHCTKDHVIKSKEEMDVSKDPKPLLGFSCKLHPREIQNCYCVQCDKITCNTCQLSHHRGHSHQFVSEIVSDVRNQLNRTTQQLKYDMTVVNVAIQQIDVKNEKIDKKKEELKNELNGCIQEFAQALQKVKQSVTAEIDAECDRRVQLNNHRRKLLQDYNKRGNYCADFIIQALQYTSDTCIVFAKQAMLENIQKFQRSPVVRSMLEDAQKFERPPVPHPDVAPNIKLKLHPQYNKLLSYIHQAVVFEADGQAKLTPIQHKLAEAMRGGASGSGSSGLASASHVPTVTQQALPAQPTQRQVNQWSWPHHQQHPQQQQQHIAHQQHLPGHQVSIVPGTRSYTYTPNSGVSFSTFPH